MPVLTLQCMTPLSCVTRNSVAYLCGLAGLVKDSDLQAVTVLDEIAAKLELEKLGEILSRTQCGKVL